MYMPKLITQSIHAKNYKNVSLQEYTKSFLFHTHNYLQTE